MSIRVQRLVLAATPLFAFLVSSESQAAPHARDGFYLQLTTGLGVPNFASTTDESSPATQFGQSEGGLSIGGSLLLGVPLRPGIVVGGGALAALCLSDGTQHTQDGRAVQWDGAYHMGAYSMAVLGPFVDLYPSPALGWHVQALVGYARLDHADTSATGGLGFMAGIGHDWWLGEHWSGGLLARVTYVSAHFAEVLPDGMGGSHSEHDTIVTPSLEASFTFH
jgi:hypothetical protein